MGIEQARVARPADQRWAGSYGESWTRLEQILQIVLGLDLGEHALARAPCARAYRHADSALADDLGERRIMVSEAPEAALDKSRQHVEMPIEIGLPASLKTSESTTTRIFPLVFVEVAQALWRLVLALP